MSRGDGGKTNNFLKLKAELGLYHGTSTKLSPTVVGIQQKPENEKSDPIVEISGLKSTTKKSRRKVCKLQDCYERFEECCVPLKKLFID